MKFDGKVFSEPLLEFGDQHAHADPRLGLMEAGPLQTHLGDAIQVGIVGSDQTIGVCGKLLGRSSGWV